MARSNFKTVYIHRSQFKKFLFNSEKKFLREKYYKFLTKSNVNILPYFFFWKRNSAINKWLLNYNICVYNGISFQVLFTGFSNFKGYKLGEFSVSRKKPIHSGKRKQIKKIRNIIPKKKYF